MKILHVCLACFYIDNYAYQENLLPKYHKRMGYDVKILASLMTFDSNGKPIYLEKPVEYTNEDGIPVKRIAYKNGTLGRRLRTYVGTYDAVLAYKPDIIFMHGVQFSDISSIIKYVKEHPNVKVYADNHSDQMNSINGWVSENVHRRLWRYYVKKVEPYVKKFYGVLPARVDFLKDMYGVPKDKVELLVMGADDVKVEAALKSEVREKIRKKYNIKIEDTLVITGGKIDFNKPETLNLIEAVKSINDPGIKLIVFGSVVPELKEKFDSMIDDKKIIYVKWLNVTETYEYLGASDLAVFPGKHSVLWEQAVGMGIACIFRNIPGFNHVDLGGNCILADDVSSDSLKKIIVDCVQSGKLEKMTSVAMKKGMLEFSYKEIAKRSIE